NRVYHLDVGFKVRAWRHKVKWLDTGIHRHLLIREGGF
ncbi:MAG: hypothetical protein ACI9PN_002102, partial [Candidatus Azotimanducaceae bacterium]